MGIRSQGNPIASFLDVWSNSGLDAAAASSGQWSATGGDYVLTPGNGYKYHTFTSPGNFVATGNSSNVQFVLVAGGGGGGGVDNSASGGGGGGGMVISSGFLCSAGTHPVTVGPGGTGQTGASGTLGTGVDSVFAYTGSGSATFTAKGGGGGDGPQTTSNGGDGGSGGGDGGAATQPAQNPGIPHITNYGNSSGTEGGGGAGEVGQPSGFGGDGQPAPGYEYPIVLPGPAASPLTPYSPTNNHYAGGGGGYDGQSNGNSLGGGGAMLPSDTGPGNPGIDLLGGGGGGAWYPSSATGGAGGDGIVIIRYLT